MKRYVALLVAVSLSIGFFLAGHRLGKREGVHKTLDNVFELCYNYSVIRKEDRFIGCFPMSDPSKEEHKELDKLTEV